MLSRLSAWNPDVVSVRRCPTMRETTHASSRMPTRRVRDAGFEVEEVEGHRIAVRLLRRVAEPTPGVWRVASGADRVLRRVPGLDRLGEVVRLRAVKPT